MIDSNQGLNSHSDVNDNTFKVDDSSVSNANDNTLNVNDDALGNVNNNTLNTESDNSAQPNRPIENDLGNTTFTQEEIEAANKPQPNVILANRETTLAQNYHDRDRVSQRANEASDRNDTNTGSMIAGAAKGANQS